MDQMDFILYSLQGVFELHPSQQVLSLLQVVVSRIMLEICRDLEQLLIGYLEGHVQPIHDLFEELLSFLTLQPILEYLGVVDGKLVLF